MKKVFEPVELKNLRLKNRLVRSATWEGLADRLQLNLVVSILSVSGLLFLHSVANYVLLQSEINTKIKDAAPKTYMTGIWDAVREGKPGISGIVDEEDLRRNLEEACIPEGFSEMTFEDYDRFLEARRNLMVKKIRAYYESLK